MKHLYSYIVEPKNGRYLNEKKVGDKELVLNTKMDDHNFVNRTGFITQLPLNNPGGLEVGDEVIVHHNIFRRFYSMSGEEKNSSSYFEEDKYFCYTDQIFLYKRNGKWNTPEGYCFVKPLVEDNVFNINTEKNLCGVIKHSNDALEELGIHKDDIVGFTPNSEYEFVVDGEKLYRVLINSISIKYGRKGTEVEYNPSWL